MGASIQASRFGLLLRSVSFFLVSVLALVGAAVVALLRAYGSNLPSRGLPFVNSHTGRVSA